MPDWNKAPAWANFYSIDQDGEYWWAEEPQLELLNGYFVYIGSRPMIKVSPPKVTPRLEKRPLRKDNNANHPPACL